MLFVGTSNKASSRGGILNLDLCKASICLAIVATVALKNWSFIVYAAQALMILGVAHKCSRRVALPNVALYIAFYGAFAFWCLLSAFWAVSPDRAVSATVGVVQFIVVGTFVAFYAMLERDVDFLLGCLAWAGVALLIVLVIVTPRNDWVESMQAISDTASDKNRIGTTVGYHPNALGHLCSVCAVLWLYKFRKGGKWRLCCLVPITAFIVVLLFTKSRLSILVVAACIAAYYVLSSRSALKRLGIVVAIVVVLAVAGWALLSIPALYELAGFRFAAMFGLTGSVDASTTTRGDMTRIAFELFSRNPVTGVGFANYAVHYYYEYSGWAMTYAHNNYAELLADLGVIGTASYYAVPAWCLATLIKYRRSAMNHELHFVLLALVICLLVSDYASISYTNDFIQIFWAVAFAYCQMARHSFARIGATKTRNGSFRTSLAGTSGVSK